MSIITNPVLKYFWYKLMPSFPVSRRVFGLKVWFDSRDTPFFWYARRKTLENCEGIRKYLENDYPGTFWDLGCNIGIYSLYAAKLGWKVVSLDVSPKCASMLVNSAFENDLKVAVLPRGISIEEKTYFAPKTASAGNTLTSATKGDVIITTTYKELEKMYGIPHLIKMDIEGTEREFLEDKDFRNWLLMNEIALIVDIHNSSARNALGLFRDVINLNPNNYLVHA